MLIVQVFRGTAVGDQPDVGGRNTYFLCDFQGDGTGQVHAGHSGC